MDNEQALRTIKEHLRSDIPPFKGGADMSLEGILDGIVDLFKKYVVLSTDQVVVFALYVAHTFTYRVCDNTPYMSIRSPEIRAGKTTFLFLLEELVWQPMLTDNVSKAALVHYVQMGRTLLIDEIDTVFGAKSDDKETLIGIINSGYRRKGGYTRMVGTTIRTFSPKVFAGIGTLPPSIEDRSIAIWLRRKKKSDHTAKFKERTYAPECKVFHDQLEKWAPEAMDHLRNAVPDFPKELNDRQEDIWEPLLNIANMASERWAELARRAAIKLGGVGISL